MWDTKNTVTVLHIMVVSRGFMKLLCAVCIGGERDDKGGTDETRTGHRPY